MEKYSLPNMLHISPLAGMSIEILDMIGVSSLATDFYLEQEKGNELIYKQAYLLSSSAEDGGLYAVGNDGEVINVNIHNTSCGIRPIINVSKKKGIPTNNGKFRVITDNTIEVEYGYYPQEKITDEKIIRAINSNISNKIFNDKKHAVIYNPASSNNDLPIYCVDDELYIRYNVNYRSIMDARWEVFKIKPVKWFFDFNRMVMIAARTLDYGIPMVAPNKNKYSVWSFDSTYMSKFLNKEFAHNLEQLIVKVWYLDLKTIHDIMFKSCIELVSIEELKKEFTNQIGDKEKDVSKIDNKESLSTNKKYEVNKSLNNEEIPTLIDEVPNTSFTNNQTVTMSGKFIQIIFNNQLYSLPLDNVIISDICAQDDINFVYSFDNVIVRNDKSEEDTFKINNALRIAYIKRLSKLPLNEDIKEYIKKYDKNLEYNGLPSVTIVKTIVNELAYIYYKEYTSKYNDKISKTQMKGVNLDKGFDENYYENIISSRSK